MHTEFEQKHLCLLYFHMLTKFLKKLISESLKSSYWNMVTNGTYVKQPEKISNCAKFESSNFKKNDTVKAKNAEITNYAHI